MTAPKQTEASNGLIAYQLTELKIMVAQGFERMETKFSSMEGRIVALEIRQAKTDTTLDQQRITLSGQDEKLDNITSQTNRVGMSAVTKIALAALGILSTLIGLLGFTGNLR